MAGRETCKKCGEASVINLRSDHTLCKSCFSAHANHKFRSAFGKAQLIRAQEPVLVAVSGSDASTVMLSLILQGLSPSAPKKMRFVPTLVYIDESCLRQDSKRLETICDILKQTKLPAYVYDFNQTLSPVCTPIRSMNLPSIESDQELESKSLSEKTSDPLDGNTASLPEGQIASSTNKEKDISYLVTLAKTHTAKDRLIHIFRNRLLSNIAQSLNINKVLLADSATSLSANLLSGIAEGMGSNVAASLNFAEELANGIIFVRPMREFQKEEISVFLSLDSTTPWLRPVKKSSSSSGNSLQNLTNEFVEGLQGGFNATVSTVFRTGLKMTGGSSAEGNDSRCCLCYQVLPQLNDNCSAATALEFSQNIVKRLAAERTKYKMEATPKSDESSGQVKTEHVESKVKEQIQDITSDKTNIEPKLCYSCLLMQNDFPNNISLADICL